MARSNVKITLNSDGVRTLLRDPQVTQLEERAARVEAAAGEGYDHSVAIGRNRAIATIFTATFDARLREATEHRLPGALDAGRNV